MPLSTSEETHHWTTHQRVCGIDEAGRGPLAGPVVAAAVVFPRHFTPSSAFSALGDSKAMSARNRERLTSLIMEHAEACAVAVIDNTTIDRINIFQATMLAMNQAAETITPLPSLLLIDGNRFNPALPIPYRTIVKGDAKVFSIAAASVLAKTTRDRLMRDAAELYPEYGFEQHFGYPTRAHTEAIRRHGRSPFHRQSFRLRQLGEK
ncbi:ribonuclease HII [Prosthecochloris sp. CIB 2401]|uniref:ribonuclease HII n=1 Tax=Prosthecochloris sp. CIB 2401 TaxID=1868325 RepID=UPI00080A9A5B|nr:ribonuclease HII [Prosthecochloris sp. CIB 2401]ANT63840.1 Ribonuclease HII [Prosthecochloris sp. CIB 2401]